jgi:hypothetical protein
MEVIALGETKEGWSKARADEKKLATRQTESGDSGSVRTHCRLRRLAAPGDLTNWHLESLKP